MTTSLIQAVDDTESSFDVRWATCQETGAAQDRAWDPGLKSRIVR